MKKYICALVSLMLIVVSCSQKQQAGIYNVMDYGAIADGKTLTMNAIQSAIDACANDGGGVVMVPKGDYLTGTLNLKANVEFRFEQGARLIATTDLTQYQRHNDELAGVFYTEDCENVSITGPGVIFGQGMEFMYADSLKAMWTPAYKYTRQGEKCRQMPDGSLNDGPVEPRDRYHQMIVFSNCKDVTLTDFKCIDSPYWCFIIVHCDGVMIRGLRIDNNLLIPNSDGVDLISSSNVTMSDCDFSCGDDAIAITGYDWHYGDPGPKRIHRPMRNINITNCNLRSRSSGIRIGLWDHNPLSDFNFSNINIYDSNCGIGISVRDSCGLENMNFNNINIHTRLHSGDWWGNGEPIKITSIRDDNFPGNDKRTYSPGAIRNMKFTNVNAVSENTVLLYASNESLVENITFQNCDFTLCQSALEAVGGGNFDMRPNSIEDKQFFAHDIPVFYAKNIKNLVLEDVRTHLEGEITVPYIKDGIVIEK